MNWDAIGAIGELIGATAVVVTLLYLVIADQAEHGEYRGSWIAIMAIKQHGALAGAGRESRACTGCCNLCV